MSINEMWVQEKLKKNVVPSFFSLQRQSQHKIYCFSYHVGYINPGMSDKSFFRHLAMPGWHLDLLLSSNKCKLDQALNILREKEGNHIQN